MSPLQQAIILRSRVRAALARGDGDEVARLDELGTAAYLKLSGVDALAYLDWAFGRMPDDVLERILQSEAAS